MFASHHVCSLFYPIITNRSFEAFSCYTFGDGTRWLISDVSIQCDTWKHTQAKAFALAAILIYPVGCFLLNGALLFAAREDIRKQRKTPLSSAISFLYEEYQPEWFWWELAEWPGGSSLLAFWWLHRLNVAQ